jgi:ADP-ribosyl-[dinitrogen reductase] hydrolase
MKTPPPPIANSHWIEPGRLLGGEYPKPHIEALLAAGVTYFIDLTRQGELPPYDLSLPSSRATDQRYIVHVRKAIDDHGVPNSPEVMADILDYIERAIEAGHCVYVHCRAGIGRTNTVLGCWLRRRGASGAQALELLNRLWQANGRSSEWTNVPETEAQEQFIRDWQSMGDDDLGSVDLQAARTLRDRYQGAILGLACGDALGAVTELQPSKSFAPITEMVGGGHWQLPPGAWTDDTAMALCLAESLLTCDGFDAKDQLNRYVDWQRNGYLSSTDQCIGIGAAVAKALSTAQWSGKLMAGSHDPKLIDPEPVARAGIVALFASDAPQRVFVWAADSARLTHQAPGVLDACRCYAALVLAALRGANVDTLVPTAATLLREYHGKPLTPRLAQWMDAKAYPAASQSQVGNALSALTTALWALGVRRGYRDGLLRLVNLGGRADAHGALFGLLAGALYGAAKIPPAWRGVLAKRELLEATADRLLAAALAPNSQHL